MAFFFLSHFNNTFNNNKTSITLIWQVGAFEEHWPQITSTTTAFNKLQVKSLYPHCHLLKLSKIKLKNKTFAH